jgi:S1-C subfamily serine protease
MDRQRGFGHVVAVVLVAAILAFSLLAISDQLQKKPAPRMDASQVASAAAPAVVSIEAALPDGTNRGGTGLLLTSSGDVMTNNHLIAGTTALSVDVGNRRYAATVLGYDAAHDVAVLALTNASRLPTVKLADSSTVAVGDQVAVVARAVDSAYEINADAGRVTALDQNIDSYTEHFADMVAVEIPTHPVDNSGAILDKNGDVVALITAPPPGDRFRQQTNAIDAYAIPINTVVAIADHIEAGRSGGTIHVGPNATLGVSINNGGAVVQVDPAGPAAHAGITRRAIIVAVNYKKIATQADITSALIPFNVGDSVHVDWAGTDGVFHSSVVKLTG